MEIVEYLQLSAFLQAIVDQIVRRDWEGFMGFVDRLIEGEDKGCQPLSVEELTNLNRIKNIAAHMQGAKTLALGQRAILSPRSEYTH